MAEATPRPWDFNPSDECLIRIATFPGNRHVAEVQPMEMGENKANAALITHCVNHFAELVALIESTKEAADNCEESLEGLIELRGWIVDRFESALTQANTIQSP